MEVYIHLHNGIEKSPNLNCTFHLAGEVMRAKYATVN